MNSVSFSVLIPAYNCERTIVRCLQSVLSQSYKNYKVYVINDCSTDGTKEILDNYYRQGKIYFLYHHEQNAGSVVGRKELLKIAQQDYILFIDSDDQFMPNAFQVYADLIEKYQLDIVVTDFDVVKLNPNAIFQPSCIDDEIIVTKGVFDYSLKIFHHFLLWNKAIKNQVAKKIQVPDKFVYGCDDHMFSLQLYLNAKSLGVFRTQSNYRHYYGAGQWGRNMDEQTMRRFCCGYKETLLYNFEYVLQHRIGKKYFKKIYERYESSYLRFLAKDNQNLVKLYDSYFNDQFISQLEQIIRQYK